MKAFGIYLRKNTLLELNDIVVSRVGSYGNFALIPNDKCCLGQNVALIHPNINPKYLYHVLMSYDDKTVDK